MPIPSAPPLVVTADERAALAKMSRSSSLPERQVIAAKGLMLAADGVATIEVARRLGVSPDRVRRWRARFASEGIAGIGRIAPGRGRKPSLPEGKIAEIVRTTLEERIGAEDLRACFCLGAPDRELVFAQRGAANRLG